MSTLLSACRTSTNAGFSDSHRLACECQIPRVAPPLSHRPSQHPTLLCYRPLARLFALATLTLLPFRPIDSPVPYLPSTAGLQGGVGSCPDPPFIRCLHQAGCLGTANEASWHRCAVLRFAGLLLGCCYI